MLSRRALICGGSAAVLLQAPVANALTCTDRARYDGRLLLEPRADGRYMRLAEPFEYVDQCSKRWSVPAGAIVDGASIPRPLWSLVGGPFEGKYRSASVIHDWFCAVRVQTPEATHRMFYDAMLTSAVTGKTARLMYLAVKMFGPTWDALTILNNQRASLQGLQRLTPLVPNGLKVAEPAAHLPGGTRGNGDALTDAGKMREQFLEASRRIESQDLGVDQIDLLVAKERTG